MLMLVRNALYGVWSDVNEMLPHIRKWSYESDAARSI